MYCRGLGLRVVASFEDHEGFDGVILGLDGAAYHFEFTHPRKHPISPTPTIEDLVVFYVPSESKWEATCARMQAAGFRRVASFNPYWEVRGCTFEDCDGYRIVLEQAQWTMP
jgi:catechol 2,3-dioxygenase-like lactoylglutathione lyase family enzyme